MSKRLSKKSTWLRRKQRDGLTALEFALISPAFFILLFAAIEFCRLNMIRNLTQDAAYFAARHAMVPGATEQEAIDEANRILAYMNTQNANVVINGGAGLDDDSDTVAVTITVPVSDNSILIPQFTSEIEFTATATMRTERYDGYYDPFSS